MNYPVFLRYGYDNSRRHLIGHYTLVQAKVVADDIMNEGIAGEVIDEVTVQFFCEDGIAGIEIVYTVEVSE